MEILQQVLQFWNTHAVMILGVALGISEALALIPGIKSNSIFQFVVNALKAIAPKKDDGTLK